MAYIKDMDVHDAVVSLTDLLKSESDPAVRLLLVHRALQTVRSELVALRNETAYEARQQYAVSELERVTGINHGSISVWTYWYCQATGKEKPRIRMNLPPVAEHDLSRLPADRRIAAEARRRS